MIYSALDPEALEWWFAQPLTWRVQMTVRHSPDRLWRIVYDDSGQFDRALVRLAKETGEAVADLAQALGRVAHALKGPTLEEIGRNLAQARSGLDETERERHRKRSMKREDKSLPWNRS